MELMFLYRWVSATCFASIKPFYCWTLLQNFNTGMPSLMHTRSVCSSRSCSQAIHEVGCNTPLLRLWPHSQPRVLLVSFFCANTLISFCILGWITPFASTLYENPIYSIIRVHYVLLNYTSYLFVLRVS